MKLAEALSFRKDLDINLACRPTEESRVFEMSSRKFWR